MSQTMPQLEIPPELSAYKENIEKSKRKAVRMDLTPAVEPLPPWVSKIGGHAYMPPTTTWPRSASDNFPLKLLAQINFAHVPKFCDDYPEKGILQFFVHPSHEFYGMNLDGNAPDCNFRAIYHENVVESATGLQSEDEFMSYDAENFAVVDIATGRKESFSFPINYDGEFGIEFHEMEMYMGINDFRCADVIFGRPGVNLLDILDDIPEHEVFESVYSTNYHMIGGYPYFTQTDCREERDELKEYELLLQITSQFYPGDANEIMWGDAGVANFFIHPDDLRKRDFSKVFYNWDCT